MLAAGAAHGLRVLLYGVEPLDPVSFGSAALLVALVAATACAVPARRAVTINPVDALRAE